MGTFKKIMQLTADMTELADQREKAVADLVSDLEWMDVPVLRVADTTMFDDAEPGDTFHLIHQIEEGSSYDRISVVSPDNPWCEKPIGKGPYFTRGKKGSRFGHTYLGEHIVIGWLDGKTCLTPRLSAMRDLG